MHHRRIYAITLVKNPDTGKIHLCKGFHADPGSRTMCGRCVYSNFVTNIPVDPLEEGQKIDGDFCEQCVASPYNWAFAEYDVYTEDNV